MAVAEGADEHVVDGAQEELLECLVRGVILFVELGGVDILEVDVGNLWTGGYSRNDGVHAWICRWNKCGCRQCVVDCRHSFYSGKIKTSTSYIRISNTEFYVEAT